MTDFSIRLHQATCVVDSDIADDVVIPTTADESSLSDEEVGVGLSISISRFSNGLASNVGSIFRSRDILLSIISCALVAFSSSRLRRPTEI